MAGFIAPKSTKPVIIALVKALCVILSLLVIINWYTGGLLTQAPGLIRNMKNVQKKLEITPTEAHIIRDEAKGLLQIHHETGRTTFDFDGIPQDFYTLRQMQPLHIVIWSRSEDPYGEVRVVFAGGLMHAGIIIRFSNEDAQIPPPAIWETHQVISDVWTYWR